MAFGVLADEVAAAIGLIGEAHHDVGTCRPGGGEDGVCIRHRDGLTPNEIFEQLGR